MKMYSDDMRLEEGIPEAGLEASLLSALEHPAEVDVPPGFAARVIAALPAPRRAPAPLQLGRKTAVVSVIVLSIAMFALAPHTAPTFGNLAFDTELLVIAQLAGITYWLTVRRET